MDVKDSCKQAVSASVRDDIENYRRLVELQSQIVELARCNRDTELLCQRLRERVERKGWVSGIASRRNWWKAVKGTLIQCAA